jgi:hypothetical protein
MERRLRSPDEPRPLTAGEPGSNTHMNVDWNAQAAEKASQYQDTIGGFSRSSMIQQLTTADYFTHAQAEHGADSLGL